MTVGNDLGRVTTTVPTSEKRAALHRKLLISLSLLTFFRCAAASPRPLPDPCSLLDASDIRLVQGDVLVDTQKSVKTSGDVAVAQCYLRVPEESRSVTLEITRASSPAATRALWKNQFEPKEREEREQKAREVHGVEVSGIGEDAMWTGNRVSGALYVRTSNTILRISLGGTGAPEVKLERAKLLARRAIQRLEQR
jgi:hypothetical protein